MRRLARILIVAALFGAPSAALLAASEIAQASVAYQSPYTYEQTFGTTLRLIRVDLGLKVVEKDTEGGYVIFEYKSPESGNRVSSGSVELVRGISHVHVAVQLPAMPNYHEQMVIDMLTKKLLSEHGEPPRAEPPKPAPRPGPDAGEVDGDDDRINDD